MPDLGKEPEPPIVFGQPLPKKPGYWDSWEGVIGSVWVEIWWDSDISYQWSVGGVTGRYTATKEHAARAVEHRFRFVYLEIARLIR